MKKQAPSLAQEPKIPAPPQQIESTILKERMVLVIKTAQQNQKDAEDILAFLNANPQLDAPLCRMFQINPLPRG